MGLNEALDPVVAALTGVPARVTRRGTRAGGRSASGAGLNEALDPVVTGERDWAGGRSPTQRPEARH
jgi:hypothetical protein